MTRGVTLVNNKPKNIGMHLYVVIESSKAGFLPFLLNFNKIILPQLQAYLEKLCENIKPFLNDYYLQPLDYKGLFLFYFKSFGVKVFFFINIIYKLKNFIL